MAPDSTTLDQIVAIVGLREAQGDVARTALRHAEAALDRQQALERDHLAHRDQAWDAHLARLGQPRPDPTILHLSGTWLLGREQDLTAAQLDTAIAGQQRAQAASDMSLASARIDASREIRRTLCKVLAKARDERQASEIADRFLHRRWR